ncbi:MAG: 50S ribosomal protein L5 [Chlamydiales bacterium]
MSRLKQRYQASIREELTKKFGYSNTMLIPSLKKIVINMGIAEAAKDKNLIQDHMEELTLLSGQKPIVTRAKKSISNFKLREGQAIGLKVTLRGKRMYDFLDRFINIVCPRIRDFRGFSLPPKKKDGKGGCYSLGLNNQEIFPEINPNKIKREQGATITFVSNAETDEECIELLRLLGLPYKNLPVVVVQ